MTVVSLAFLLMPSINSAIWLLIALLVQIYVCMYILIFISVIRLRYTKPDVKRSYKIPGGKPGIWIVGGLGLLTCLFIFFTGFWPKAGLDTGGEIIAFEAFLIVGMIAVCCPAFIFYSIRKPDWRAHSKDEHD